jgi:PAS domain-containing protein
VAIYTHTTIGGISGVSTLKGFQIGVQSGDACIHQLANHGITTIVEYPNYTALLAAAGRQEIKLFCLDEYPANFYLYKTHTQGDFRKAFELYQGQFRRATRKGDTETLRASRRACASSSRKKTPRCARSGSARRSTSAPTAATSAGACWRRRSRAAAGRPQHGAAAAGRPQDTDPQRRAGRAARGPRRHQRGRAEPRRHPAGDPRHAVRVRHRRALRECVRQPDDLLVAAPAELIGKHLSEVMPGQAARTVIDAIEAAAARGHDYGRTVCLTLGDGAEHWFELSATRKQTSGGEARVLVLSRDITERREAERAILAAKEAALVAESNRHFRALFEAAPVALAYCQGERIESINQRFIELFGYRPVDIPTWPSGGCGPIPTPTTASRCARPGMPPSPGRRRRRPARGPRVLRHLQGREKRNMIIGGQLLGDGFIATFTDITLIRETEATLKLAKEAADAANMAKSAFLANMSHEIRTPMNAILGYTRALRRGSLLPEQVDRLDKIEDAGHHLLAVINDILDISKIEAGKLTSSTPASTSVRSSTTCAP